MRQVVAFTLAIILLSCANEKQPETDASFDRIQGMLLGSAIADALAGPHEGRRTEISQQFLHEGGWIDSMSSYNNWFQTHWNVYKENAPPGTVTDDTRLRLFIVESMIAWAQESSGHSPMTREYLAEQVFDRYRTAQKSFETAEPPNRTESFLDMWFWWESAKCATSVNIPVQEPLVTPRFNRIKITDEDGYHTGHWELVPAIIDTVNSDMSLNFHDGSYHEGKYGAMGQITLLPLAAYFPGNPEAAFQYGIEMDFFDIGIAPLFPAIYMAIISDGLAGNTWEKVSNDVLQKGIRGYTGYAGELNAAYLDSLIDASLSVSSQYKNRSDYPSRKNYIDFVTELHTSFALGNVWHMCTCEEMLTVPLAMVDYSIDLGLNSAIEMGVNYGRDNDTVASFVASIVGAFVGRDHLNTEWITKVNEANPQYEIVELSKMIFLITSK